LEGVNVPFYWSINKGIRNKDNFSPYDLAGAKSELNAQHQFSRLPQAEVARLLEYTQALYQPQ
jgi:hypothetical protein